MQIFPDFSQPKELALSISAMWLIFILSLITLNYLVFRPTLTIIKERTNRTKGLEQKTREMRDLALLEQRRLEQQNEDIARQTKEIRDAALAAAETERSAIMESARQESLALLETQRQSLEQQRQLTEDALTQTAQAAADQICDKLIQDNAA